MPQREFKPNISKDKKELEKFPRGFTWGVATSAYQIEGSSKEDGKGESIWDRFSHTPGKIKDGSTGDIACDHYHRFEKDIKLMKQLGVNAYRFSISWPRILPDGKGKIEAKGLDFYSRLVDSLLEKNITPWITLYHWDLPQTLEEEGGWPNRKTADYFASYVDIVTKKLGDRVKNWITINEPYCASLMSYYEGIHAPGRTNLKDALTAAHTLLLAHGKAIPVIRSNSPKSKVGIVLNNSPIYPIDSKVENLEAANRFDGVLNKWFLDPLYGYKYPKDMVDLNKDAFPKIEDGDMEIIARPTDFLGVNYYSPSIVRSSITSPLRTERVAPENAKFTQMGWTIYPEGLYIILKRIAATYPISNIYVTENGAAFADVINQDKSIVDNERTDYLEQHLMAISKSIKDKVPIKGYFAWTLIDNFEWAEGFTKRFGLVSVNFQTQERIIKQSGHRYSEIIRKNSV